MAKGEEKRRCGKDSRVCHSEHAPYTWHDYVDPAHAEVVAIEAWLSTLQPFARSDAEGRIDDLKEAAQSGALEDSGDETTPIKPISHDPDLYELRITILSKKFRYYHGEPAEWPELLVSVHEHIKTSKREQQASIEHAADRYRFGLLNGWT